MPSPIEVKESGEEVCLDGIECVKWVLVDETGVLRLLEDTKPIIGYHWRSVDFLTIERSVDDRMELVLVMPLALVNLATLGERSFGDLGMRNPSVQLLARMVGRWGTPNDLDSDVGKQVLGPEKLIIESGVLAVLELELDKVLVFDEGSRCDVSTAIVENQLTVEDTGSTLSFHWKLGVALATTAASLTVKLVGEAVDKTLLGILLSLTKDKAWTISVDSHELGESSRILLLLACVLAELRGSIWILGEEAC